MTVSEGSGHPSSAATRLAVARESLEATPVRAIKLLRGIGGSIVIRSILLPLGFTRADLEEGWSLLRDACSLGAGYEEEPNSAEAADAVRVLDAWDEQALVLVGATLTHRYPRQAGFLLAGLAPHEGPEAIVGVAKLLDRLDALENDPHREESRDDDHAALDLLAKRGITKDERGRLRALVRIVQRSAGVVDTDSRTAEGNDLARLVRLRAWYDEWSQICRVAVRRPELLRRLGLAGGAGKPAP